MKNLERLKKQHLAYFEEKRNIHKSIVAELYKEYVNGKIGIEENELFIGFYEVFANKYPIEIYDSELIVGTAWFWKWAKEIKKVPVPHNHGHFIVDFEGLLKLGLAAKISKTENENFKMALNAFSLYIKNHAKKARELRLNQIADDCEYIAENAPKTFRQALQFVWFTMCFLNMEASEAGISLGRMDSYLYSYYKNDIANGNLTPEDALKLIMCFYIKASEGDESCMLTVGGDDENELTILFLEAQAFIDMRQPSISLRVSKSTSDEVLESAKKLVLVGSGMPAYFNDDAIIRGLEQVGIDNKSAEDYAVVGCYESAPQGIFANTVAVRFNLYDSFDEFISDKKEYKSFDEFLNAYKSFFKDYYEKKLLPGFKDMAEYDKGLFCPFAKSLFKSEKYLFGINILGIGVMIDSIYTVKKLVFEKRITSIENLKNQAGLDFADAELYSEILSIKTSYGSNEEESNNLANEISKFVGETVLGFSLGEDVIISPALFWFTGDIWQRNCSGTINGRKTGELLSYGVMPCATPHKNPLTSVLLSCGRIATEYFPNGCPVMISLDKTDVEKENTFSAMIKAYFEAGGAHLAVNIADAKTLEKAKEYPMEYSDLMVKISGYSAKFISLKEAIQDAIIKRANK